MSIQRIIGLVFMTVGVVLMLFGYNASQTCGKRTSAVWPRKVPLAYDRSMPMMYAAWLVSVFYAGYAGGRTRARYPSWRCQKPSIDS